MKRLALFMVFAAVAVSACAVAEQARPMTEGERLGASSVASAAGFDDANLTSQQRDLFGGNYQEYLTIEEVSASNNPRLSLSASYRRLISAFPSSQILSYTDSGQGVGNCTTWDNGTVGCGVSVVVEVTTSQGVQNLRVSLSASSSRIKKLSIEPYYPAGEYRLSPAPRALDFVDAGE